MIGFERRKIVNRFYCLLLILIFNADSAVFAGRFQEIPRQKLVENTGQIKDQFGKTNLSVLYQFSDNNWNISICDSGFRYQYNEFNKATQKFDAHRMHQTFVFNKQLREVNVERIYNANQELSALRFKNVLPNINLLVETVSGFKYSFELSNNADPSLIRWRYFGINNDNTVYPSEKINLTIDKYTFTDDFPAVFIENQDGSQRNIDKPQFIKIQGTIALRFNKNIKLLGGQKLIIDPQPTLNYSTYFGGGDPESRLFNTSDDSSNTYIAGYTASAANISTTGSYKTSFGGNVDGFIAKFSASNSLMWSTYFGGGSEDKISGIVYSSKNRSIYISGYTQSNTGIATSGAHQTSYAGGTDAFLAKFSNNGKISWCTYFGGSANDRFFSLATTDTTIVAVGLTESSSGIATSKGYQTTYAGSGDGMIAEFYQNGTLKQATYFGGSNPDELVAIDLTKSPSFIVAGNTSSSGLGTGFTHSSTINGQLDGFVAQFDNFSTLDWCTYYGGKRDDEIQHMSVNSNNEVIISGGTYSSTNIATSGSYQDVYGGSGDGFLAFIAAKDGTLNYATYFGGTGLDNITAHHVDYRGNIAVLGVTQSDKDIATIGALQTTYNGNFEGFIAKFSVKNKRWWSSYLGQTQDDYFQDLNYNLRNNYVASGHSASSSMATTGAYQTSNNGNDDGLMMLLSECPTTLTFTTSKKDIKCFGEKTGEIKITMSDLSRDFLYGVNPRQLGSSSTITNLAAGKYRIYAVDSSGCVWFDSVELTESSDIIINPTITSPTCFGSADGQISLSVSGGLSPYSYFWNTTPSQTSSSITNLIAGSYTVTVKDGFGCTKLSTIKVNDPIKITVSTSSITHVDCFGKNTGSVTLSTIGGTAPFTYKLGTGSYQASNVFSGLGAGSYLFTAKDAKGCEQSITLVLTQPAALSFATTTVTDVSCKGASTGIISVSAKGGTSAYSYQLGAGSFQASGVFSGLVANTYLVTVKDAKGCVEITSVTVNEPAAAISISSSVSAVDCNSKNTGSVTLTATGGTSPYTYQLGTSSFQVSSTFSNLSAGTYNFTVKDANGCTQAATAIVTEPAVLTLATSSVIAAECKGSSTGIVSLTGSGGTSSYTYQLGGGSFQSSNLFSGLAAGNYTFTIKDAKTCTTSIVVSVTEPTAVTVVSTSVNHVNCNGTSTGSVTVSATGGTSPYTYQLGSGSFQVSGSFSGLSAGTYTFTAKDAKGCTGSVDVVVKEPTALNLTHSGLTNVNCNGASTGSITLSASGGTPSYSYQVGLSAFQVSNNFSGLTAGTKTFTVKDANGCTQSYSVNITEPTAISISTVSIKNVDCFGTKTGNVTIAASGGISPYSYNINSGTYQSSGSFTSLVAGKHTLTAKDANGCIQPIDITITEPTKLVLTSAVIVNVDCKGKSSGSITLSASGGTGTYSYSIGGPYQGSATFSGLAAGSYTGSVLDGNNCLATFSFTITEPTVLSVASTSITHVSCKGFSTGSVTVSASGGTPPYSYQLGLGPFQTSGTFTGLAAGNYTFNAKDANGCTSSVIVNVTEPTGLTLTHSTLVNVDCNGGTTGSIRLSASGGTTPYTYQQGTGVFRSSNIFTGLAAGTATFTVKDANGCTQSYSVVITEPTALSITALNVKNVECNGSSNGSLTVLASGGVTPYTYKINSGIYQSNGTFSSLTAGIYTVVAKDANGCLKSIDITITEPAKLTLTTSSIVKVDCKGKSTGAVTFAATGGISPYTYSIGGTTYQSGASFSGLTAGSYTGYVLDANNCPASISFTITEPLELKLAIGSQSNVDCNGGKTGSVALTATGGTSAYSYQLGTAVFQSSNSFTGLSAGNLSFTVKDVNGCLAGVTSVITEPSALVLTSSAVLNVDCKGSNTGSVTLSAAGGTSPYSFKVGAGSYRSNNVFDNLTAGVYTFMVLDANGCTNSLTITITEPTALTLVASSISNVDCNGDKTGSLILKASGSVAPYTYTDGSGSYQNISTFINLAAGVYTFTTKDANGCTVSTPVTITEPTAIVIDVSAVDSVNCFKGNDGSINASVTGGTGVYTYLWDDPTKQTTAKASNLEKGTYTLLVTDAKGCKKSASATVNEPNKVSLSVTLADSVNCFNGADGSVSTSISGGSKGYKYLWNDPSKQTAAKASGLKKGTFKLIAKDVYGCSDSVSVTVNEPEKVTLTVTEVDSVNCFNGSDGSISTSIAGGSKGYRYLWNDPAKQTTAKASGLKKGTFKLIAKDLYGCSDSVSITVNEPEKVTLTVTEVDSVNCFNGSDGSISTTIAGGSKGYKYLWNDPSKQTTAKASGLSAGTYKLVVKDIYGCSDSITRTVNEPLKVSVSISSIDSVNCYGGSDGSSSVTVNGGSNGYKYLWNDPTKQTNAAAINLSKGTYKLIVKDIYNCSDSITVNINEPNKLEVSLVNKEDISCFGKADGEINVVTAGGTLGYRYTWSHAPSLNSSSATIKYKGNFKVIVSDYHNCKDSLTVSISEPDVLKLVLDSLKNPNCYKSADGYLAVKTKGGNGGDTYKWFTSPIRYGNSIGSLKSGWYKVEVNDVKGCMDTASYRLQAPDSLDASLIIDTVLCYGGNTGRILVMPKGGTPGYSYEWLKYASNNTALLEDLTVGTYFVTVTDKNGCKQNLSGQVFQPSPLGLLEKIKSVSCFDGTDGQILVRGTGGQKPYAYHWETRPGLVDSSISGLTAGIYRVYITDRNKCAVTDTIKISQPTQMVLTATVKQPTCYGSKNGEISLTASGGVKPYVYKWNISSFGNVSTVKNLTPNKYSVLVTDKNGCQVFQEIIIKEKDSMDLWINQLQPRCFGEKNGEISLTVRNNQGPAKCQWTTLGGLIGNKITNLGTGKYAVLVTDSVGCKINRTINLAEPKKVGFVTNYKVDLKCKGDQDGSISVMGQGGVGRYTYSLGGFSNNTGVFRDLSEGTYLISISDSLGCNFDNSVRITSPDSILIKTIFQIDNKCFGESNGEISISNLGGIPPYQIKWSNSEINDTINNLVSGFYSVVVSDKNNCSAIKNFTITEPTELVSTVRIEKQPICPQNQSGSVSFATTGGTPPYMYISPLGTTSEPEFLNLDSGKFYYMVEDINGCVYYDSIRLDYERNLSVMIPQPLVFQQNRYRMIIPKLTGIDSTKSNFLWSEPDYFEGQQNQQNPIVRFSKQRTVYVTITDDKGCTAQDSAQILLVADFGKALPNSFTPNDDGLNDVFDFPEYLNVNEFRVFDRFGKVLFEQLGDNPSWDGYYNNELLPQGNYVYLVKFTLPGSTEVISVKGIITILK